MNRFVLLNDVISTNCKDVSWQLIRVLITQTRVRASMKVALQLTVR